MRSPRRRCKRAASEQDADFQNSHAVNNPPQKKKRLTSTKEMKWQKRLQELGEFRQTHGHCRVPQKNTQNISLGNWVSDVRKEFGKRENGNQSYMTAERIAKLNNLGFDWGLANCEAWEIRFRELQEFHQNYGHCRVPKKKPQNPSLGLWRVSTMRKEFKKRENGKQSSMTAERIAKLNNLGFDWAVVRDAWEIRLQDELQEFHQTHGHCRVPQRYQQNPSLGVWVSNMRREFKKWETGKQSSMTAERIAKLNNLGFDWAVHSEAWEIRLRELQEFYLTHGHCRVPRRYQQNPSLGMWVNNMRAEFKKRENGNQSSMTAERIAELNYLGFDWALVCSEALEI